MPWHRRPSSLEYDCFQVFLYLGWRCSWRCSRVSPVTVSMTGMSQLWIKSWGNCQWDACRVLMSIVLAIPLGLICKLFLLEIGLLVRWMGAAGVVRLARVRWAMGLSVLMSVMSGGGMMSTLGAELGGVCMTCTLGACVGEVCS